MTSSSKYLICTPPSIRKRDFLLSPAAHTCLFPATRNMIASCMTVALGLPRPNDGFVPTLQGDCRHARASGPSPARHREHRRRSGCQQRRHEPSRRHRACRARMTKNPRDGRGVIPGTSPKRRSFTNPSRTGFTIYEAFIFTCCKETCCAILPSLAFEQPVGRRCRPCPHSSTKRTPDRCSFSRPTGFPNGRPSSVTILRRRRIKGLKRTRSKGRDDSRPLGSFPRSNEYLSFPETLLQGLFPYI